MPVYGFNPEMNINPVAPWGNASRYNRFREPSGPFQNRPPYTYGPPPQPAKVVSEDLPGGKSGYRRIPCNNRRGLRPFRCENAFSAGEELYSRPVRAVTEVCCDFRGCGVFSSNRRSSFWPDYARPRWLSCAELYPPRR